MMTVQSRITMIRMFENLRERYENGDKNVIKTETGYKLIGPTGETIMEIGF